MTLAIPGRTEIRVDFRPGSNDVPQQLLLATPGGQTQQLIVFGGRTKLESIAAQLLGCRVGSAGEFASPELLESLVEESLDMAEMLLRRAAERQQTPSDG